MTEVYDGIAKEYQESKYLPFRRYSEEPTLMRLLGNLDGKAVLDLACGEGIYSRRMRQLGAKTVVGVDISPEMIALAEKLEAETPQGITYAVHDASIARLFGEFDIVVASYLLNYARTRDELTAFCANIFANLKPGGCVVGMNDNPANNPTNYPRFHPYGFTKSAPTPRLEGSPVTYTFHNPDGTSFSFDNYFLEPATYDAVFRECGFRSFQWEHPGVTSEGFERHGREFWEVYNMDPPVIGFVATK